MYTKNDIHNDNDIIILSDLVHVKMFSYHIICANKKEQHILGGSI